MADHNELGKLGEEMAVAHLVKNDFVILDVNWRFRKEELDIVAKKNNLLIFVEVKTRESAFYDTPASTVTMKKQKALIKVADEYIRLKELMNECRFDIIFIIHNSVYTKIEHIEDAFYATL